MSKFFLSAFLIFTFLLSGCSDISVQEENPEPEQVAAPKKPEKKIPKSDKFYIANKDFSNLQLQEFNKPVYDAYGIWERQAENLPMSLPDLQPFEKFSIVYLTFDDGPDDKNTPAILDILRNEQVPATFYVLGYMAEKNPGVLKRIFEEGHAIGNHSYNHDYNDLYAAPWNFVVQMYKTDDVIMKIIGVRPLIIRAPGGSAGMFTENYWPMIKAMGYVEHGWNVSTEDATGECPDASTQINHVLNQLGKNPPKTVIILMHSNSGKEETVKALPELIHLLKDWGYKFGVVTPMTPLPW